jgi:hypothetical protein
VRHPGRRAVRAPHRSTQNSKPGEELKPRRPKPADSNIRLAAPTSLAANWWQSRLRNFSCGKAVTAVWRRAVSQKTRPPPIFRRFATRRKGLGASDAVASLINSSRVLIWVQISLAERDPLRTQTRTPQRYDGKFQDLLISIAASHELMPTPRARQMLHATPCSTAASGTAERHLNRLERPSGCGDMRLR